MSLGKVIQLEVVFDGENSRVTLTDEDKNEKILSLKEWLDGSRYKKARGKDRGESD